MSIKLISLKKERSKIPRAMSPAIQTRWYRAPEIILTEQQYNESIDIWSAGLILAELMKSTENYP